MSNNINLKQGLNVPISGKAALEISKVISPDVVAVKPSDFRGLIPRLLVKEGEAVLAGSPVLADKKNPEIIFASPVSGTIQAVVRGDKRKLLAVLIKADKETSFVDFGAKKAKDLSADQVKKALLESGLWPAFIQRPYGIIANPEVKPKAIFVSAFNSAPSAAEYEFTVRDEFENIQTGINAIAKLTDGGVHVSYNAVNYNGTPLHKLENVKKHIFDGVHPAGNVGVQIHHISPILKGETVWTITPVMLAAIGKLFNQGKYDVRRKIAITGPAAIKPSYVSAVPGLAIAQLNEYYSSSEGLRFISGDILSGTSVGPDGHLGFYDSQVSILREGNHYEMFGWCKPFRTKLFSFSKAYFSWLTPKKVYDMDTNLHGGVRPFVMNDVYSKVLPMDLYPVYLAKACLAKDIEKMEKYGIYEVLEEDLALCEYVCPSKIDIQAIISDGIDLMLKEMA